MRFVSVSITVLQTIQIFDGLSAQVAFSSVVPLSPVICCGLIVTFIWQLGWEIQKILMSMPCTLWFLHTPHPAPQCGVSSLGNLNWHLKARGKSCLVCLTLKWAQYHFYLTVQGKGSHETRQDSKQKNKGSCPPSSEASCVTGREGIIGSCCWRLATWEWMPYVNGLLVLMPHGCQQFQAGIQNRWPALEPFDHLVLVSPASVLSAPSAQVPLEANNFMPESTPPLCLCMRSAV